MELYEIPNPPQWTPQWLVRDDRYFKWSALDLANVFRFHKLRPSTINSDSHTFHISPFFILSECGSKKEGETRIIRLLYSFKIFRFFRTTQRRTQRDTFSFTRFYIDFSRYFILLRSNFVLSLSLQRGKNASFRTCYASLDNLPFPSLEKRIVFRRRTSVS